jgi:hypothetical protein
VRRFKATTPAAATSQYHFDLVELKVSHSWNATSAEPVVSNAAAVTIVNARPICLAGGRAKSQCSALTLVVGQPLEVRVSVSD